MEQNSAVPSPSRQPRQNKIPVALARAILKVQQEVQTLTKTERNEYAGYTYVGIDAFYEQVVPITARAGIFWTVRLENMKFLLGDSKSNAKEAIVQFDAIVDLKFMDGTVIPAYDTFFMMHPYAGPQTTGSAKSYASKAFMREEFKIATGEGDADSLPPPGYATQRHRPSRTAAPERVHTVTTTTPEADAHRAASLAAYRDRDRQQACVTQPTFEADDLPYGRSLADVLADDTGKASQSPAPTRAQRGRAQERAAPAPEPTVVAEVLAAWEVPSRDRTAKQHEAAFQHNIDATPTIKELVSYWEDEQDLIRRLHNHNAERAERIKGMFTARRKALANTVIVLPAPAQEAPASQSRTVAPRSRQRSPFPTSTGRGRS